MVEVSDNPVSKSNLVMKPVLFTAMRLHCEPIILFVASMLWNKSYATYIPSLRDQFTQQVRRFHAVMISSLPSDSLSFPRFFIYIEAYTSDQVNSALWVVFLYSSSLIISLPQPLVNVNSISLNYHYFPVKSSYPPNKYSLYNAILPNKKLC